MKVVVGTYDGGLMGWESDFAADPTGRTLQLTFAFAGHDGSVRCVALNEKGSGSTQSTLVSGGSDEIIRVFDLIKHKEVGSLLEHKAAVTAVDFFRSSHMLSGSQDGTVCVWRVADWLCLDNMRGHK
jgi:protein MAK11